MYKIFVDSACDISLELAKELGIEIVPFYISFDGENYYKEHIDISVGNFYEILTSEKVYPKTSLPSQKDYDIIFRPYLERGMDIIHIALSQKFSGAYQCAVNTAQELKEEFPDRKIEIIDSTQAACAEGLIAIEAIKMANLEMEYDEVVDKIKKLRQDARVILTVDSLEYLQRGGRVGKLSALAGSLLNIKPIIVMETGELIPYGKVRGRKSAIDRVIQITLDTIGDKKDEYSFGLLHSIANDEISKMKDILENNHNISVSIEPLMLGTTIGAHIGPSVVGIAFTKKYEFV